ncbi:hypothetical protein OH77DRAFT_1428646 [Trametes cingulata]|nr:hypothetical protein OH77DRAFT_1428646 [Trametes cingulata]
MEELEAPYGILLQHQYCLGTEKFAGFDTIHHLPVVVSASATWGTEQGFTMEEDRFCLTCSAWVAPFSRGYIDALHEHACSSTHTRCGCPWLEGVEEVPFFSLDLGTSTFPYKEEEEETCKYTGNEAQACREDSVYLSYALVVLPKPAVEENDGGAWSLKDQDECSRITSSGQCVCYRDIQT